MSALLASVRQIGRDLIDKRLWPVAVLLLAALVAVPVLIGGSSDADPVPAAIVAAPEPGAAAATAPPATAATTASKPAVARSAASKSDGGGKINDPFFDPPAPSEAGAGGGAAGDADARAEAKSPTGEAAPRPGAASEPQSPASASGSAKPTTPSSTPPANAPGATPTPAAAAPTSSYLRTIVRVDSAARGAKALPIARLTPLGGAGDPGAVFLGVAKAGARYAVFVLGRHATSRGQATCKGDTECRIIGLRAGQTQVVTVRRPGAAVRRFTLRVVAIRAVRTSAARARAARARVHADGREVVRDLRRHAASAAALRTARYDARAGLLRAANPGPVKSGSE